MKTFFVYISLLASVFMTGCSKYLDKEPDNRTNITTPAQVEQLLTTAYPKASYLLFCESMSDNAEDRGGSGSSYDFINRINRQSYRFEVVNEAPDAQDGPDFYWTACYRAIAAANQALQTMSTFSDTASVSAHKGEALLARAYAHFMLVTLFAKVYDPSTAATDPGVPYVTTPETEVFVQYDRKTVAYDYEMIEKDLLEGLPLISEDIYGNAPKFHFNKKAAAAFAARFYLFKQDYSKVVDFATQALGQPVADQLRPWNTTLTNLPYRELQAEYTKATLPGNLLLQEANSFWGDQYPSVRFGMGETVATSIFFNSNVTGSFFTYPLYGASPLSYNVPKLAERVVTSSINAPTGDPYNVIPLLTSEEALLNRAEAYVRLNNNSLALADINAFASKNIAGYTTSDNVTTSKAVNFYGEAAASALVHTVLDFKKAFFLHEGLRWLDIVRLKIPVVHPTVEGEVLTLTPDDNRRVLQLPQVTVQAGLQPNPR